MSAGRSVAVIGATVVAISLLIWAGVHNGRERRLAMQQPQVRILPKDAAEKAGDAGAADSANGPVPALQGKPAPAFTLVDLDGKKVSLADYKGRPVMVNFWATWCGPCKLEMPWLEEFQKRYAAQGFVILGIASDQAEKSVIASTAKKLGVTYPVLLTNGKIEDAYGGIDYMPESFYVDRSGKVLIETAGVSSEAGGKDEIEANIKKLVAARQ